MKNSQGTHIFKLFICVMVLMCLYNMIVKTKREGFNNKYVTTDEGKGKYCSGKRVDTWISEKKDTNYMETCKQMCDDADECEGITYTSDKWEGNNWCMPMKNCTEQIDSEYYNFMKPVVIEDIEDKEYGEKKKGYMCYGEGGILRNDWKRNPTLPQCKEDCNKNDDCIGISVFDPPTGSTSHCRPRYECDETSKDYSVEKDNEFWYAKWYRKNFYFLPVEPVEPVEQVEWGEKQPRTRCLKKEGKKFHHVPIDGETDNNKHYDPPLDDADCNNKCIGDNDEYGCRLNCINSKYNDECDNECNGTGNPIKKHECRINCFNRKYEDACKKECIEHKDVCKGINYIQRGYFKKCEAVKDCTSNGDNLGMFRELKQNYQKKVN